jgi:Ca-activated chloride channel homolog
MSERLRRVSWVAGLLVLFGALAFALQRFVLSAPAEAFRWQRTGIKYELLEPRALAVVLVAPVLLYVLGKSLADLPWQQRVLSVLLRITFLVLLGLGLSRLVRSDETHRIATVVLVDVSDSVADATLDKARAEIERLYRAKGEGDLLKLVAFAGRPRAVPVEQDGKLLLPKTADLRWKDAAKAPRTEAGSNIQSAMQLSYGLFPPGYLKRIVLLSDGLETEGSLLSEANHAKRFGARLYVHPFRDPPPGEVAVRALRLPDKVDIGQPFDVTAEVYASRATTAKARLYQGETLNGLEGVRDLALKAGENEVKFKSVVRVGGEVTYGLKLSDIADDHFAQNNGMDVTLDVPGRPQVLYIEGQPQRGSYLVSALSAQQFDVDLRPASAMPGSLRELERYDFFILSDVPREAVSDAAQDLIEKYVRDLGGGFLFAGGEAGYGLGGWGHSTLERLLPVRMDAERRKEMPGVAMALVIDVRAR